MRRLIAVDASAFLTIDWGAQKIRPAAAWFADTQIEQALGPILERPYDPGRPGITEGAVERGRPLLLSRVEDWPGAEELRARLERDLPPEQARRTWRWYREASAISCPVRTAEGRSLGVLAISSTPPLPPLDEDALALVEALAGLAAVAIDRAELLSAEAERRREERALREAGRAIAASLEREAVYRSVVEETVRALGGGKVALSRYREPLACLEVVASHGFGPAVASARFALGEGMIGRVAEAREPYVSRPEDRPRFLRWLMDGENVTSFAHVPMELGPRLFGVLSAGHQDEDFFSAGRVRRLTALGALAAAAIANAEDYEHEARTARALVRDLIPSAPEALPGVELGVRYEPAERQPTGGDLYGAWAAHGGVPAVLIGDASGKGLEVAGIAAMVRYVVDARSFDCDCPARVLADTNALVRTRLADDGFVTAFLAFVLDGELRWCNAGHAPPLLVPSGGGEPLVLGRTGLPLGVEADAQLEGASRPFATGDLLVAYTDGLAEARRDGEQFGERELLRAIGELRAEGSAQAIADGLYERAVAFAGEIADDAAVLVVRRSG